MAEDSVHDLREKLAPFLKGNPASSVEEATENEATGMPYVGRPWGDDSLAFTLGEETAEAVIEALNALILPERLSAIWHSDIRKLEIIWTARKLPEIWNEVKERKFTFIYKETAHICHFTKSSDRLLTLAGSVIPLSSSTTSFRNMTSFAAYIDNAKDKENNPSIVEPLSFWVSNIDWSETKTLELLQTLNFYLTYFDFRSPVVIIHDPVTENSESIKRTRYLRGKFPSNIKAKPLDQNLIAFWHAGISNTPMLSFILYYRIIEYAASHYIDNSIRSDLKKIISAPDLTDNLFDSIEKIVGTVTLKTLEEVPRFKAVIRNNVRPELIWKDVKENIATFSKETRFDGGFSIKPLCSATEKEGGFCQRGLDQFSDSVRKIRNTLSHGKDQETAGMILPTTRNISLLRPWVHLMATAAGEVVLYKDVS